MGLAQGNPRSEWQRKRTMVLSIVLLNFVNSSLKTRSEPRLLNYRGLQVHFQTRLPCLNRHGALHVGFRE